MNFSVPSLINAGLFFVASSLIVLVGLFIFKLVTKYNVWDEINNGNKAVSLAAGGIAIGICNIIQRAILSNADILSVLIWGGIGIFALLIVYFAFEILTPKLDVTDQIIKGNVAVGFISFIFSLSFSFIIGACIS